MKSLILVALIGFSSANAGIGGASGGHVNFQRESTFVSPLFSKSLCFDGVDFHADVSKCVKWSNDDDRDCLEKVKVHAVQPQESTRERCDKYNDNRCELWKTVPFIQSEVRKVDIIENDRVVANKFVKVKQCK